MFYDKFLYLCKQKGIAPSRAALDAGISKSLVSKWKTAHTEVPSPDILKKLSLYFCVPVSFLLDDEKKNSPSELPLTEGEKSLIELFRKVPEDKQAMVLQMIRAALETK